jgi:hypothetical protein
MTTKIAPGGILPDFESAEFKAWFNEADKREEQQRKEAADEEAREAALQRLYDTIDANLSPHLKAELAAENETARVTPKQKADFAGFRATCTKWGMPYLPAMPQAVAIFLAEGDADTVLRRCKSISVIHRAVGESDPCEDVLVRAIVRQARSECSKERQAKVNSNQEKASNGNL